MTFLLGHGDLVRHDAAAHRHDPDVTTPRDSFGQRIVRIAREQIDAGRVDLETLTRIVGRLVELGGRGRSG
ncbi:MAG TPA: hypothetical protein VN707_04230, partial [Casimicrobiaceae bacterium]|nr:hypothetical protein [Casimicrobiaceae bacterium]